MIIIQKRKEMLRSLRELLKTVLFFLVTLFLTGKYHPLSGSYACGWSSKWSPKKDRYLLGPGESNKNWNQNFLQLFFQKTQRNGTSVLWRAMSPMWENTIYKNNERKINSHSMLNHSILNRTHSFVPLSQPEVTVYYWWNCQENYSNFNCVLLDSSAASWHHQPKNMCIIILSANSDSVFVSLHVFGDPPSLWWVPAHFKTRPFKMSSSTLPTKLSWIFMQYQFLPFPTSLLIWGISQVSQSACQ